MFRLLLAGVALLAPLTAVAAPASHLALDPQRVAALGAQADTFADALPLALDARVDGAWWLQGDTLHWQHEITVDGAEALALTLDTLRLPAGARLTIGSQQWQGPLALSNLFTRHQPGTRLPLQATLPRSADAGFALRIGAVQAAFRDPFTAAPGAKAADACTVNFSCAAEAPAMPWASAVVALIVMNTTTCTGTLLNNSAGDARPYLLTARHCVGSSDPVQAAGSLRMAWNAVAPCGTPLAGAWTGGALYTEGAVHRAATGDAWLVELASRPPTQANAWYAGFDASDQPPAGAVTGVHHGGALQRQVLSFGNGGRIARTAAFLAGIDLLGWAFAPERGAAAAGSSGSALFDAEGRLIGTLSTGVACGAGTPQVTYARLAQAWSGDGTAAGALRPWLDPAGRGSTLGGKSFAGVSLPPLVVPPATPVPVAAATDSAGGALGLLSCTVLLLARWRRRFV